MGFVCIWLFGWLQVRVEVMGKKVKNVTYISGNDAGKIAKKVAKVYIYMQGSCL